MPPPDPRGHPGMRLLPDPTGAGVPEDDAGVSYRSARDPSRSVAFVSRDIATITGHPAEAFIGGRLGLMDVVHPADRGRVRRAMDRIRRGHDTLTVEYRVMNVRGGCGHVLDHASLTRAGGTQWMDGTITHRDGPGGDGAADPSALRDPLTGCANRTALMDRLALELRSPASSGPVSLLLVDVDALTGINRLAGHEAGDRLLVAVARLLEGGVRAMDLVARPGGAAFAVVLAGTPIREAAAVAERLRSTLPVTTAQGCPESTVGIGLAQAWPGAGAAALLDAATMALVRAKRGGGDRLVVAGPGGPGGPTSAA